MVIGNIDYYLSQPKRTQAIRKPMQYVINEASTNISPPVIPTSYHDLTIDRTTLNCTTEAASMQIDLNINSCNLHNYRCLHHILRKQG